MPAAEYQMIAVRPRQGGTVHATSLTDSRRTACGINCDGWIVAPLRQKWAGASDIKCKRCKQVMFLQVNEHARARR